MMRWMDEVSEKWLTALNKWLKGTPSSRAEKWLITWLTLGSIAALLLNVVAVILRVLR